MKLGAFLIVPFLAVPLFAELKVPKTVSQGQFVEVRYEVPPLIMPLRAKFLDSEVPCYINPDKINEWVCMIAVPANAPTGHKPLKLFVKDKQILSRKIKIIPTKFPLEPLPLTKEKKSLVDKGDSDEEKLKIRAALKSETSEKHWDGPFMKPVEGPIESRYGERRTINGKIRKGYYHRGTDFGAKEGTLMLAANGGTVVLAGPFTEEGNMVMINHGHGIVSVYMHCLTISVNEGDVVKKGDRIALVGSTGVSNSPHLHFGIYLHGVPIDALFWLNRELPY